MQPVAALGRAAAGGLRGRSVVLCLVLVAARVAERLHLGLALLLLRALRRAQRRRVAVIGVDVDALRTHGHVTEVCPGRIEILHEVVLGVPLPHDRAAARACRTDLEDPAGPESRLGVGRIAAKGRRFLARERFPGERQDVAVGQRLDVVVQRVLLVREHELPAQRAVGRELLDSSAESAAEEGRVVLDALATQQRAIRLQVDAERRVRVLPRVHDLALHVDQVRRLRAQRREQGVALERLRLVPHEPARPLFLVTLPVGFGGGLQREREEQREHALHLSTPSPRRNATREFSAVFLRALRAILV